MSLNKEYVRDGRRRIIGSETSGYSDTSAIVRDEDNEIVGRTSERFHTTRDDHGNLVSINSPDAGLLLGNGKQR
jgi:YD repeat-containing protein